MAFSPVISSSSRLCLCTKTRSVTVRCSSTSSSSSSSSSSSISTTATSVPFDLQIYWTRLIGEINKKLEEAIPVKYPERIYEAMRYSVLDKAAKRAPPIMCIASSELFGIPRAAAFPTACALEMIHAASLIHDDLPCMDDAVSRRGRPTNHSMYGVDMAILAGDALFPLGFQHIVTYTPPDIIPEARILRVIAEFARAVGSTGMAAGQFLDLRNGVNSIEFVQEKKFGEMAECSAACGGLLAGATEEEVAQLRRYGRAVGVLYQVVEDVMEANKEKREGEEGKKEKKKKKSFVKLYGLERALERAEELRTEAKKVLEGFENKYGEKVAPLYSFVDYAVERGFVVGDQADD